MKTAEQREGQHELMTAKEVADLLGIGETTFHRMRSAGGGPQAVKLPGIKPRYRRTDVEKWLKSLPKENN